MQLLEQPADGVLVGVERHAGLEHRHGLGEQALRDGALAEHRERASGPTMTALVAPVSPSFAAGFAGAAACASATWTTACSGGTTSAAWEIWLVLLAGVIACTAPSLAMQVPVIGGDILPRLSLA